jgi:16S rRNA (cytidine1402-2'-O)-methyltransferase
MKLSVVGLPIGNIEDISLRALSRLSAAEVVICEDTRYFNSLWQKLSQLGHISTPLPRLMVLNDFNEKLEHRSIFDSLVDVETVVLVSDAGMPVVSDPGFKMIDQARLGGADIEIVPGPTALTTAVVMSGLAVDKMLFVGFLPKKPGKRLSTLMGGVDFITNFGGSMIIYESPFRLGKLVDELSSIDPQLEMFVAVDMTKHSQKTLSGSVTEMTKLLKSKKTKGECTVVIGKKLSSDEKSETDKS